MTKQRGFTLVELSIVLVILGLLVGGVLTGQSLIRAAEMRSVTTEHDRYQAAIMTFRDKYMAFPGDLSNAESYWGTAASGTACFTTAGTGTQTCNGDGNSMVDVNVNANEYFRLWQHLANAGLIEGNYDGIQHGSNYYAATRANSPTGRISGSLWASHFYGPITSYPNLFVGEYGHVMAIGAMLADSEPISPLFKPEDAYNIDSKMDDGMPAQGKVVISGVPDISACTNTSNTATLTASYSLTSTTVGCGIVFRNQY